MPHRTTPRTAEPGPPPAAGARRAPAATRRGLAMFVLIFASFMDLLDVTIVNVALPSIRDDLHTTASQVEWITGGYTLAFAITLITGGRLGDIFGRKHLFLTGVAGFTVASLAACTATDGTMLVAARITQGAFAALMVPQVLASAHALYRPKERAAVLGIIGGVTGMAAVIGPLLGGWLVTANAFGLHWRGIFLINIPVGLLLIAAAAAWVPNTRSAHPLKVDIVGVLLSGTGLALGVYALVEGRSQGWPAWIWAMLAASPVLLGIFAVHQRRRARTGRSPLVPMNLFADRGFASGSIVSLSFQVAMAGFFLVITLFVQLGLGFSAIRAGLVLLPFALGSMLASAVSVPLAAKAGKPLVVLGALAQAAATLWTRHAVAAHTHLSGTDLIGPMALGGIGLGLLIVPLVDLAVATVDARDAGAASGVFSTFQQLGASLGIAVTGVVFFNAIGTRFDFPGIRQGILHATLVTITAYGLCAIAALFLPKSNAIRHHTPDAKQENTDSLIPA